MNDGTSSLNGVKTRLRANEPTFGVIVTVPSVAVIQSLASAGVDWVIIDMEHGPVDATALHAMIAATAGTRTVPFVRLPWSLQWQAKSAMDLGALGIVFPMICTREQAEQAVRAVRYPPDGDRLWGPFYAPMRWSIPMPDYIRSANANMLAIATIEHPDAIRNIDEIASTSGLDLAFIGPGDLAMSLGVPGQFDHPDFTKAVAAAEAGILGSRVALGGVARTPEQARRMIDRGYRALVFGFDWLLLQQAAARFIEEARS
ncbi:MAG: aldolase/citrate lyase family protein [Casimicrobiaceae bacterium]